MQAIQPYIKTAEFYDYLLSHVDYKDWAGYIKEITDLFKLPDRTILDIACGTGSFVKEMQIIGFKCFGVELSESMIRQATKKNLESDFKVADMISYISPKKMSVITCLFDSINYLDHLGLLKDLCDITYDNLKNNGLFIFDSVTESHCLTHYFDYSEYDTYGPISYERRCQFDIQNKIQRSTFVIKEQNNEYIEVHNQFIYGHQAILDAIDSSKLNFIAAYADFTFDSVTKKTERIHYVCRKKI